MHDNDPISIISTITRQDRRIAQFDQGCRMKAEPRQRLPRFAVFIDAENVSPKFADGIFREIAQLGDAPVRLIYGNLSDPNLKGWAEVLPDHSLERRDPAVKGRNSADMAIVIDAMDLLHDGRIGAFADRKRGWMGAPRSNGAANTQTVLGFRYPYLWPQQAQ